MGAYCMALRLRQTYNDMFHAYFLRKLHFGHKFPQIQVSANRMEFNAYGNSTTELILLINTEFYLSFIYNHSASTFFLLFVAVVICPNFCYVLSRRVKMMVSNIEHWSYICFTFYESYSNSLRGGTQ